MIVSCSDAYNEKQILAVTTWHTFDFDFMSSLCKNFCFLLLLVFSSFSVCFITNQKCKNRSKNGSSSFKFAFGCIWLHLVAFELHSVAFDCIGGWFRLHCVASVHLVAFFHHRENSEATVSIIFNDNHFHIRITKSFQHNGHS